MEYENYEPPIPEILFGKIGDTIEGRFVGFDHNQYGTVIKIELESGDIKTLPYLTQFAQMIPDLEKWNNEYKEIYLKFKRIEDISTPKGPMKNFEIGVNKQ